MVLYLPSRIIHSPVGGVVENPSVSSPGLYHGRLSSDLGIDSLILSFLNIVSPFFRSNLLRALLKLYMSFETLENSIFDSVHVFPSDVLVPRGLLSQKAL